MDGCWHTKLDAGAELDAMEVVGVELDAAEVAGGEGGR